MTGSFLYRHRSHPDWRWAIGDWVNVLSGPPIFYVLGHVVLLGHFVWLRRPKRFRGSGCPFKVFYEQCQGLDIVHHTT